jgi:alpha-mannosidase
MPALHPGTAEGFFAALEAGLTRPLPVWAGELYFELHRGCYTSQGRTKWYNRKLEAALHDAEFVLTWAHVTAGLDYPRDALRHAWDVLLTHQFHDILPGSSIRETYIEAEAAYADALALTEMLIHEGLVTLAATSGGGQWAVVNTLGHARRALAVITADLRDGDRLVDEQGQACIWQNLGDGRALVLADLPPFGMRALRVEAGAEPAGSDLSVSPHHLENAAVRVEFDGDGRITRVYDKAAAREALPSGAIANHFQLYQDMPARWQAWDIDADYEEMPLSDPLPQGVRVIESGPVRAAVEVTYAFGASMIRQQISLTRGARAIDFDTEIDWHERHTLLKVAFPLDLQAARATFESAYGAVERPTHRSTPWDAARFEVPTLRWADLSESGYGAALLNDCKYGCDVHDNVLRLSLLRAPTMPDPEADQGEHRIRYALLLHDGGWQSGGVVAEAAALNQPARVVTLKGTGDALPVAPVIPEAGSAVIVDTLKLAEDSGDVIVRLYEPHGARQRITLRTAGAFTGVHEVNILEEAHDGGDLTVSDLMVGGERLTLTLRPYQVRTLRLTR